MHTLLHGPSVDDPRRTIGTPVRCPTRYVSLGHICMFCPCRRPVAILSWWSVIRASAFQSRYLAIHPIGPVSTLLFSPGTPTDGCTLPQIYLKAPLNLIYYRNPYLARASSSECMAVYESSSVFITRSTSLTKH